MLEEDENLVSADVYITPPDQGELTDQDSGPEDDCGQMDNLARDSSEALLRLSFTTTMEYGVSESKNRNLIVVVVMAMRNMTNNSATTLIGLYFVTDDCSTAK